MEISEKEQEPEGSYSVKKSRRVRKEARFASAIYRNDSFSNSDDSEDKWNDSQEKKYKKTVPKQTLKLKLLEKTRKLRQLGKFNSESKQGNIIQTSSIDNDEKETQVAITMTDMQLESNFNGTTVLTTAENQKPLLNQVVNCDSRASIENVKHESLISNIVGENETKILKRDKNLSVREPIVIEYSINRSQDSDTNALSATFLQSYTSPNNNSNLQLRSSPCKTNSLSISSRTISMKNSILTNSTESDNILTNCKRNEPANVFCAIDNNRNQREKIAITAKFSLNLNTSRNQTSNNTPSVTSTNRCKISKNKSSLVTFQQTPNIGFQRISSIKRSNSFRIVKNFKINDSFSTGSKKMNQNLTHEFAKKIVKNNNSMLAASTNSVFNKLNNISPNGTVIYTGTGSVTITPRKVTSEKVPTQRKLFKNEIEGIISGRNIEGILRYVVNLANGTFIPLSDLQIKKLREQNKGTLPIKLKIPVPCDVADKIEPSFIIED